MKMTIKVMAIINVVISCWFIIGGILMIVDNEMDGYTTLLLFWAMMLLAHSILIFVSHNQEKK